jgi:secondary thiamine-phosphate synthase enzyme
MKAIKSPVSGVAPLKEATVQGTVRVVSRTITVDTHERLELLNLTDEISSVVSASGISEGYVQLSSLHTTAGIFINEWQDALLVDIKTMIESLVPRDIYYRHNDPEFSDCDRSNSDSHLRNVVFGLSLSVPISRGELVLGRWQSVIMAEFDGPNQRKLFVQALGT